MTTRVLDVVGAAIGLVVLAPFAVIAAVAIACDSRGGVLYRAERMGRDGQVFSMLKLRTLHRTAGPRITAGDDERITRVGRVLRRLHVDEWPQLWNVIRGDMSLVGPRPEDPSLVDLDDARWRRVLAVRPGITGPTQLAFAQREAECLRTASAEHTYVRDLLPAKLASDDAYVATRSLARDVSILARTLVVPLRRVA